MKHHKKIPTYATALTIAFLSACTTIRQKAETEIHEGMSASSVMEILGKPHSTGFARSPDSGGQTLYWTYRADSDGNVARIYFTGEKLVDFVEIKNPALDCDVHLLNLNARVAEMNRISRQIEARLTF